MKKQKIKLSRAEKILLVLYDLSEGVRKSIRYEDIVVAAFKKYPLDFQLRGYSEYPDSGDLIHKPLYGFRKKGLLEANNKVFTLTKRGLLVAAKFKKLIAGYTVASRDKLSRYAEGEISRVVSLEGFQLFLCKEETKITDTDFYNYLGATVRTKHNDLLGRLESVTEVVEELESTKEKKSVRAQIPRYHKFMMNKFEHIIDFKVK